MRPSGLLPSLLLAGCVGCSSPGAPSTAGQPPPGSLPDVLIVVLDTTGPAVVEQAMPVAQAFLDQGLSFTSAWAGGNSTVPGTGAIFKGAPFWEAELRAVASSGGLHYRTLPQQMKERGYRTVLASSNPVLDRDFFHLGFDEVWIRDGEDPPPAFVDGATVDWFVQAWQRQAEPRFGWIQLNAGHDYFTMGGTENPSSPALEQLGLYHAAHLAEAAMTDAILDRVLGLVPADQGTVILTADHAELFGDRGAMLFDGQPTFGHGIASSPMEIHVPLGLRGPGIAPGSHAEPVSNIDVFDTAIAAAGLPAPRSLAGPRHSRPVLALCDIWSSRSGDMTVLVEPDGNQLIRSDLPASMGGLPPLLRWTPGQDISAVDPDSLDPATREILYRSAMPSCLSLRDLCRDLGPIGYVSSAACEEALR